MLYIKRPGFSAKIFIISSLSAFITVGIFYSYFSLRIRYKPIPVSSDDKYYLAADNKSDDPFITKVPNLKDILAGPIISSLDPSAGDKSAPVTIVEFSDFTCGFCQKQEKIIKKIMDAYKNNVRLLWKDYPDQDINSLSYQAAVAARCAAEQSKFWPYHDWLYSQSVIDEQTFGKAMTALGLDKNEFNECLSSSRSKKLINDNIEEANALEITGVPFIYVNDQEVMGEITYEDLERIVKIELGKTAQK